MMHRIIHAHHIVSCLHGGIVENGRILTANVIDVRYVLPRHSTTLRYVTYCIKILNIPSFSMSFIKKNRETQC